MRDNKESLAEEVTGVVTDVIGESVSQTVENEAKGFVDDLAATLEELAAWPGEEQADECMDAEAPEDEPESDEESSQGE